MREIWTADATAQAELIRSGVISAKDVVTIALERADQQASLGATTVLLPEYALARAETATGPFAGVPMLLKDAGQELKDTPYWLGTKALQSINYRSTETTPFTKQLETLGFIIIGKAAVPELMTDVTTEPPVGPPTRNPWNEQLTAGGSSGGSAAAVAGQIVPLAHGSDSTGSLRYPASACGVFSLRPTTGRIPSRLPANLPDVEGMHADFVLTRSVRDLHAILARLSIRKTQQKKLRRIGVPTAMPFGLPIETVVNDALRQTADSLAEQHDVVAIKPAFLETYGAVLASAVPLLINAHRAGVVDWVERHLGRPATPDDLSPNILEQAARGRAQAPEDVARARDQVHRAAAEAARWTSEADALLLPIFTVAPWPVGEPVPDASVAGLICSLSNYSGQPAVAIPTVQRGVPIGVQLQGSHGADEELLQVAASVRSSAPTPR